MAGAARLALVALAALTVSKRARQVLRTRAP